MSKENSKCPKHPNRDIKYICLSSNCYQDPQSCIICLKNDHVKCSENMIISADKTDYKSIHLDHIGKIAEVKQIVEENLEKALQDFEHFYSVSLEKLIPEPAILEENKVKLKMDDILRKKDDYFLEYNQAKKKIEVIKASIPPDEIPEFIKELEERLKQLIDDYYEKCLKVRLLGKIKIAADEFIHHPSLTLINEGNGMRLGQPTDGNNYYLCIAKNPLQSSLKLRLTVDNIYESDRYVEIGFMTPAEFKTYSDSLIGKFVLGSPSYAGYSKKDLNGVMPTTSMSSELGLINGCSFCFEYDINTKNVKVFDDRKLDLNGKSKDEIYLYFCIYFTNQTVLIEPYD